MDRHHSRLSTIILTIIATHSEKALTFPPLPRPFKNSWEISLNMEVVTRGDRIWGTNFPAEIEAESSGDKNPSHQGRWTGPVHLCDTCTLRCSDARLSSWLSDKESTCQRKRWVPPLVQEDLTCLGATKPAHHNY